MYIDNTGKIYKEDFTFREKIQWKKEERHTRKKIVGQELECNKYELLTEKCLYKENSKPIEQRHLYPDLNRFKKEAPYQEHKQTNKKSMKEKKQQRGNREKETERRRMRRRNNRRTTKRKLM